MKFNRIPVVLAALAVALPAISMADPGDRHDHDRDHRDGYAQHDRDHDRPDWDHPGYRHDYYRGAGPNHDWQRGSSLPREYWGPRYVVNDWRGHHLSAPPRGYHWVSVNGDYVLAAVATGIILDTLLQ